MYKAAAALKTFFSGFGYPAYSDDSVPDDVELPYIVYSVNVPGWTRKASIPVRIWDRTRSNTRIIQIADQITAAIGSAEHSIPLDGGGYLTIWQPDDEQIQIQVDGDYRYAYFNLWINAYIMPGE